MPLAPFGCPMPLGRSLRCAVGIALIGIACAPGSASARAKHTRPRCASHRQHHRVRRASRRACTHKTRRLIVATPAPITIGVTKTSPSQQPSASPTASTSPAPFHFFSASSFWNLPLGEDAALDPASTEIVNAFNAEIAGDTTSGLPPWINTTSWSVPIYTVPADQPTVSVVLEPSSTAPALQAAWRAVPVPAGARPAAGNEKVLVVWQPSSDRLWEFWRMESKEGRWHATWGGAMQGVSSDPGFYGPWAWPEAKSGWGVSASSLDLLGGLISLEDLARGEIDHAIAIAVPNVRAGVYAAPAQRTDGASNSPRSLPEGARLRLDPHLDLQALHLPHLTMMIAQAAQRYGFVVRDHAPNLSIYAQDPTPNATNPYSGPTGYFERRSPRQLLAGFPWSHLELLSMELHTARDEP
jgi:hypothetical protein